MQRCVLINIYKNDILNTTIDVVNNYYLVLMNIQQFQYVIAVVDSKNFETAAERCFITQSTLSTMIGRFENEIGIKIFNRKTKPVSLTTEGKAVVKRLRIVLNEIDSLDNVIQDLKGEMTGELKIGIIPTIAPYILPLFLVGFSNKFPNVKITVEEITTPQIKEGLLTRTLDVGLLALPIEDPNLLEYEIYKEPFLVYDCRKERNNKKITVDNLDYSKLWLLQKGHCLRSQVFKICEQSCKKPEGDRNFKFESGSMGSLVRFTKTSEGMTILPYLASLDLPVDDQNNLVEFEHPVPVRSVGLLTHKFFVKKKLLEELIKTLEESVSELLPSKPKKAQVLKPF